MAHIMTKRGSQDNVVTFEHFCDDIEDMEDIDPAYINLGSACVVLSGRSGGLEFYLANSDKEWISALGSASVSGSTSGE